jgi:2-keto-3-deoxy-L-rhamnonate aldolase RhmA
MRGRDSARRAATLAQRFLDVGILGILAPKVCSEAEARALVMAVKFPSLGARGAAGRSRASVLLESREGIENLEAILAVPGLD